MTSGVASLSGVDTGVTSASTGSVLSTSKSASDSSVTHPPSTRIRAVVVSDWPVVSQLYDHAVPKTVPLVRFVGYVPQLSDEKSIVTNSVVHPV